MRHIKAEHIAAPLLAACAIAAVIALSAHGTLQSRREAQATMHMTSGDPQRGAQAIISFGCGSCHQIAHIPGATGRVGPDLTKVAEPVYAGAVANRPEDVSHWIQDPRAMRPDTAMPDLGVDPQTARDIVAYLYLQNNIPFWRRFGAGDPARY
jgi:cytochrome c2